MLLYFNAFIALLTALLAGGNATLYLLLVAADAVGAYGIANERKWGYKVAIVAAILPFVLLIAIAGSVLAGGIINLLFEVALVALLLHPMSRSYY
ncbi:MAG: hypothetical protein JWM85_1388, partial [Acidimicrobiaceae bacterium]|nr:hypothetical protein [Acidimicrobiaceae bacterium]